MNGSIYDTDADSLARLKAAIEGGLNLFAPADPEGRQYPLGIALRRGNAAACRMLLEAGACPRRESFAFHSPAQVVIAAMHGEGIASDARRPTFKQARQVLSVLLEYGGSLDSEHSATAGSSYPSLPRSALHYAVTKGDHRAVELLSALGANMNEWVIDDDAGGIPVDALGRASRRADQPMMVTLLRCGADDQGLGSCKGESAVVGCVVKGLDRVFDYYVRERGADLAQRHDGRTLLQLAKTPEMRNAIRALKTEFSVAGALKVSVEPSRNGRAQPIMSDQAERSRARSLSPL
jgi:ankyrin repeat protein